MAEEKEKEKPEEKAGIIKRHWLVVLILLLVAGWFYWFQVRPTKIRSYCDWRTKGENNWRITKSYNARYESCLHEHGLK